MKDMLRFGDVGREQFRRFDFRTSARIKFLLHQTRRSFAALAKPSA
jgi:hypothetical protein